tara:strand:+ start:1306 stop:1896 length:591 start_codon:yes stop_codon:yes gene_type:complete
MYDDNNTTKNDVATDMFNYYYYLHAFNSKEVESILKICDNLKREVVTIDDGTSTDNVRRTEVGMLPSSSETNWIYDRLMDLSSRTNKDMNWNFDLDDIYEDIQYSIYHDNGGHYQWSSDIGDGYSHRKLSVTLQLSIPEEYEGGQIEYNIGSTILEAPSEVGTLIIHPSYLLHRTTPIVSGVKRTLVLWISGNPFK